MNYRIIKGFPMSLREDFFTCTGFEHLSPPFRTSAGTHFFSRASSFLSVV